jgi:Uma2 family endonuclease
MATRTLITPQQYLGMHFGEREPEFVDGELVERLHFLLGMRLNEAGVCLIAVRVRVSDRVMRIPDLAVYREFPVEAIPTAPPRIIVEIASPDDRHEELLRKLGEYRAWGVEHIWVVEPEVRQFHVYSDKGLAAVDHFAFPESGLVISAGELFAEANAR